MPKTINSKRNPLTNDQRHYYRANLMVAQAARELVKELIPTLKYTRVFTEAQANGVCRMKFYNIHNTGKIPDVFTLLSHTPLVTETEIVNGCGTKSIAFKVSI